MIKGLDSSSRVSLQRPLLLIEFTNAMQGKHTRKLLGHYGVILEFYQLF